MTRSLAVLLCLFALAAEGPAPAQEAAFTVTGTVVVSGGPSGRPVGDVVVSLTPRDGAEDPRGTRRIPRVDATRFSIVQRNKRFSPGVLAVPVGATVDFPNRDPFFHNVFSMFNGRRFDLGLYEGGGSRPVTFDHAGVSFVFCNIHPEMSAVVISLDAPHFAVSARSGDIAIPGVPPGRYRVNVWHERYQPATDDTVPRELTVGPGSALLGTIRLVDSGRVSPPHKNKYGRDYNPAPVGPLYGSDK